MVVLDTPEIAAQFLSAYGEEPLNLINKQELSRGKPERSEIQDRVPSNLFIVVLHGIRYGFR